MRYGTYIYNPQPEVDASVELLIYFHSHGNDVKP